MNDKRVIIFTVIHIEIASYCADVQLKDKVLRLRIINKCYKNQRNTSIGDVIFAPNVNSPFIAYWLRAAFVMVPLK